MNLGEKIIQRLREEVGSKEYERYLKHLHYDAEHSRSDRIIYHAPNIFTARWIQSHYAKTLAHLFEIETNVRPKVEILLGGTKSKETPGSPTTAVSNKSSTPKALLNPSFTFESFIVGSSNQFAYTTAKSVAEKPGKQYNPLFIYGGVGLGKTHLLQAIGNYRLSRGDRVIYTTLEHFMNKFISHLQSQTMELFRENYRQCDLLLIDDIQFLSRKEKTQDELFHTFNELHNNGRQIVLSSDRPPKKIAGLEDRLRSRFEWGILADIQPPELETKIAIIQKKCELDGIHLDNEIIHYIATHMGDNIREIEGTIIKLNALSTMLNQPITLEFARNAIKDQLKEKQENVTIDDIVRIVSRELNVKPSDIRSKKRTKNVVNARRIVIYLARNLTPNSMPQIALYFGMKDHSAVSHALRKINEIVENDENFKVLLQELSNKIGTATKKVE
ncbi:chromosomal replication initiator protein DnaA [Nitratifractor sp.]